MLKPCWVVMVGMLIVAMCDAPPVRAAPEADPLPTSAELHQMLDRKEYQPLLQKMVRVMQLKGPAAQQYDRVDLLMMRGEALLQLKQQASAIEAFDSAVKEAIAPNQTVTRKPEQVALARATDLLVHQSRAFAYTPRHTPPGQKPEPISLLDPSQRDAAFKALLDDQQAELAPKAKAAARSTTLTPIIQLIRGLADLRALELIVTKATKDSDALLVDMADRADTLMDKELDRLIPAADAISRAAHAKTGHTNYERDSKGHILSSTVTYTMRGLFTNDTRDLKQILTTCEQIESAAHDFQQVTSGKQAAEFSQLSTKAEQLAQGTLQTLNDDYRTISGDPQSSSTIKTK